MRHYKLCEALLGLLNVGADPEEPRNVLIKCETGRMPEVMAACEKHGCAVRQRLKKINVLAVRMRLSVLRDFEIRPDVLTLELETEHEVSEQAPMGSA